jgi:hypothetical protein
MAQGDERGLYQFIIRIAEFHERRRNFAMGDTLPPDRFHLFRAVHSAPFQFGSCASSGMDR